MNMIDYEVKIWRGTTVHCDVSGDEIECLLQ